MVAYVVVIRESTSDPASMQDYMQMARAVTPDTLTIRALRGKHEVREGPPIEAVSILEFPSFEDAQAWYDSPDYQAALPYRLRSGTHRLIIIDGT